jgi:uncharacterized membrane protein HdeD (DUF308 family)
MDTASNQERNQQNNLSEFENEKQPKKPQNTTLSIIIGVFFIGYGIFRLTNTMQGDGSWNTFFGGAIIVLGVIRIASVFIKKK